MCTYAIKSQMHIPKQDNALELHCYSSNIPLVQYSLFIIRFETFENSAIAKRMNELNEYYSNSMYFFELDCNVKSLNNVKTRWKYLWFSFYH